MAMITYPLDNIDYSAADAGLFHCTRKSGVWAEDSFPISASGSDNFITIGSGVAWISNDKYWGKVVAQKEAVILDLGLADPVYNRIDAVVIQFDSNANATDIVVKKGTPATKPSMPEIVQSESIFELCLCKVLRPAGSSVVTSANVTDTRMDDVLCGLMADSVTKVDMTAIEAQVRSLINNLQNEIDSVRNLSGIMFESEWVDGDVIPVSKGGTGANNAEEALANLGAVSIELIWENPSVGSVFEAHTVELPVEDFDSFIIESRVSTFISRNPIEAISMVTVYLDGSNSPLVYRRDVSISDGGITFGDCREKSVSGSVEISNSSLKPYKIYGIKGVQ